MLSEQRGLSNHPNLVRDLVPGSLLPPPEALYLSGPGNVPKSVLTGGPVGI